MQASGWAQVSNFALVRALSNGTAKIDPYHWETKDESWYKGHYYSVKSPILPALSLAMLLGAIFYLQPRTMSYVGLNLMLNLAVPIALATIAQMCVMTVNDFDLSIGAYVGFVVCVAATWLNETPKKSLRSWIWAISTATIRATSST